MSTETPKSPEIINDGWVKMRERHDSSSRHKVGRVSWEGVSYDNHLLIHPDHIAQSLSLLGIPFDIHIRSFSNSKRNRDTPSGNVNSDGTLISTNAVSEKKEKKKSTPYCYFDDEHGYFVISFDSTNIAESVENSLTDGIRNSDFFKKYGEEINKKVKGGLALALLRASFVDLSQENIHYPIELLSALLAIWAEVVAVLAGCFVAFILAVQQEDVMKYFTDLFSRMIISYLVIYSGFNYTFSILVYANRFIENYESKEKPNFWEYLLGLCKFLSENGISTIVFPTNVVQKLLLPYFAYRSHPSEFIKGE